MNDNYLVISVTFERGREKRFCVPRTFLIGALHERLLQQGFGVVRRLEFCALETTTREGMNFAEVIAS